MTAVPWYRDFFGGDFWRLVEDEYGEERTSREVAYLDEVIRSHSPGTDVVDLGCGTGRHAVALAARGLTVTGVDQSTEALRVAAARPGGHRVRWTWADLMRASWPLGRHDVALAVQSWGWGSDNDQELLLRRVARHLRPDGVLVLDLSNAQQIVDHFAPDVRVETDHGTFHLHRELDDTGTRCRGQVRVVRTDGTTATYPHDFRLYRPHEMVSLVARCGFDVLEVDADFTRGRPPGAGSRYVQILARRRRPVAAELAVHGRGEAAAPGTMDLRAVIDEVEWCEPHPDTVLRRVVDADPSAARDYLVDDPWASRRLATAWGQYLGLTLPPAQVWGGAGTTALLGHLAGLAGAAGLAADPDAHPDLRAWIGAAGGDVQPRLDEGRVAVVQVERPDAAGEVLTVAELLTTAAEADHRGAVLVVDEANANYLDPSDSAAALCDEVDNLVVLRSLSKGFCCGGFRVGAAVCSPGLAPAMADLVPPLQVASTSLAVAEHLLGSGDPLASLRSRIAEVRPHLVARLQDLGAWPAGDPRLPWITLPGNEKTRALVRDAGLTVRPLRRRDGGADAVRLAVPLSRERVAELETRLARH